MTTMCLPLSPASYNGPCHIPAPPRAVKKVSNRVDQLLLDNLELLSTPFAFGSSSIDLPPSTENAGSDQCVLQPRLEHPGQSDAFQIALLRMTKTQDRPALRPIGANPVVRKNSSSRRNLTLPSRKSTKNKKAAPATKIKDHETGRIPIQKPMQRTKSGNALCA